MNLIKTVKKVMAVGTGAAMVGATLGTGVLAQDLSNYPSPFIQNGQFNGLIVVGDTANVADVLGSIDIATSLQYSARTPRTLNTASSSTRTTFSAAGEAWRVGTSSRNLILSELGSGVNETIHDVSDSISDDELPSLLRDGSVRIGGTSYDYTQSLEFMDSDSSGMVILKEDDDDEIAPTLFFEDDEVVAKYVLEFSTALEIDITDSSGNNVEGNESGILWDLEGEEIEILGNTWSILTARSREANKIELTLMGGSESDILDEDGSKQHLIEGKTYDVSLGPITQGRGGSTYTTTFVVNGESTPSLEAGDTYALSDGSVIGVREINVQNFFGGVRRVQYYLGANKVLLKDNNVVDDDVTSRLEIQDERVDNVEVNIAGKRDGDEFSIDEIEIRLLADDDLFIQAGETLSEHLEDDNGLMGAWDIMFSGLEEVSTEKIKLTPDDDNQYVLSFVDGTGNEVDVPLFYASDAAVISFGEEDGDNDRGLSLTETADNATTAAVNVDDYFILSRGDEKSFAFQYKGADKPDDDAKGMLYFDNLGDNSEVEVAYEIERDDTNTVPDMIGELKISGKSHGVYLNDADVADNPTYKDFTVLIDLNADGDLLDDGGAGPDDDGQVSIYTPAGATISVAITSDPARGTVDISSMNDEDEPDDHMPTNISFVITAAGSELSLDEKTTQVDSEPVLGYIQDTDADTKSTYTSLGAYVEINTDSNPDSVEIMYPMSQRSPAVFVTSLSATISTSSSAGSSEGDMVYYDTTAINVGAAVLASEVPNVAAQNVIAVGGPCVNAVAAELLGSTSDNCFEGFEAGKAMIKLVEHPNGNVGMVVAGYAAEDTRKASRVVAQYAYWQNRGEFNGTSLEVTQTNFNNVAVNSN